MTNIMQRVNSAYGYELSPAGHTWLVLNGFVTYRPGWAKQDNHSIWIRRIGAISGFILSVDETSDSLKRKKDAYDAMSMVLRGPFTGRTYSGVAAHAALHLSERKP